LNADKRELSSELNDRLDDLFSEEDDAPNVAPNIPEEDHGDKGGRSVSESGANVQTSSKESPLIELDTIMLSLGWEITNENLENLLSEVERLKELFKDSRLPHMFLQLQGSVGKYVASKKVDAHPDSIKLLHSVHAGLGEVLSNPDMSEQEKKKIFSKEVEKFKGLKNQIKHSKSMGEHKIETAPVKKTLATATPSRPSAATDRPVSRYDKSYQAFVDEIKQLIQEEFKELKAEIRSWKRE